MTGLQAEWDRCRWVWNRAVERLNEIGEWVRDNTLTEWRGEHDWLREGSVVAQQQMLRNFRAEKLARKRQDTARKWATKVVANHGMCSGCGARAKSRLLLSERAFVCEFCAVIQDRDRNAARVILDRAGLNPAGADAVRHSDLLEVPVLAEPGIPAILGEEDVKD
ncbi:hypothetical protein [Mycobacterium sp.]|uniref:hypothetical protein n=1 Tax=Mycobacterium sp. TaxID=1785 RepID=UPI003D0A02DF